MNNITHQEIKELCEYVYHTENSKLPKGWKIIDKASNRLTGFYAEAYSKNGEIVIVYRGTDDFLDVTINDINLLSRTVPAQRRDARKFFQNINKKYKGYNLFIAGHSLGGSLAQIIGSETGIPTVTYNAYGAMSGQNYKPLYTENIINYGNPNDPIFISNVKNQIGQTYVIKNDVTHNNTYIKHGLPIELEKSLKFHYLENMGNIDNVEKLIFEKPSNNLLLKASVEKSGFVEPKRLTNAQKIEQRLRDEWASALEEKGADSTKVKGVFAKAADEEISGKKAAKRDFLREELESDALENERFVLSASSKMDEEKFEKVASLDDYVNKVSGNNKIFTREDIDYMSAEDYKKNVKAIKYQREKIGIPTDKQADNAVKSGGMVYVHSYTRGDGVEVQAYYRARPSR